MPHAPSLAWMNHRAADAFVRPPCLFGKDRAPDFSTHRGNRGFPAHETFTMLLASGNLFPKECASDVSLLSAAVLYSPRRSGSLAVGACSKFHLDTSDRRAGSCNWITAPPRRRRDKSFCGDTAHHCSSRR